MLAISRQIAQIILALIFLQIVRINTKSIEKSSEIKSHLNTTRIVFTSFSKVTNKRFLNNVITLYNETKRKRCKRCRYTEQDIELMNMNNLQKQKSKSQINNYYEAPSSYHIKQPKTRDHNKHHENGHLQEQNYEREALYVNIGDFVNLTCNINSKEIDWYFKDKNLTTTILSNGPQLLVSNKIQNSQDTNMNNFDSINPNDIISQAMSLAKYQLSSDRESTHTLTLYVQGRDDEGSYQCIDSISETPMKKTISLYLKNKARALYSVYGGNNSSSLISIYCLSHFLIGFFVYINFYSLIC